MIRNPYANPSEAVVTITAAPPAQPGSTRMPSTRMPDTLQRIVKADAMGRWMLPQLSGITPTYIESILRDALVGSHVAQWELFDLMEDTWPRLSKNLNEIKRAVLSLDWHLEPWAEEDAPPTAAAEARAKLCSAALWQMRPDAAGDENGFEDTIYDLLDSWGKGTSVLEIDWHRRRAAGRDAIAPRATVWVHPTNYAWQGGRLGITTAHQTTPSRLPSRNDRSGWREFPPNKFLIANAKAKTGHPLGSALLRPLAWWWCAANFSADWVMNLAQVFGLPFRWANYDPNAPQATIDAICTALANMGSNGWAAFPSGTQLELKEASKTGDSSPQGDLLDRADTQCDILILGQTLTTDVGGSGSRALGEVHMDVRLGNIQAAANFAARVLNPAILRLNYGNEDEAPEFLPRPNTTEDAQANATRDQILLQAGVALPKEWLYARHDIPLPREGEDLITAPPTASGPMGYAPEAPGRFGRPVPQAADDEDEQVTLNGAQVTALAKLAEQVSTGQLPLETAVSMALASFPSVPEKTIRKIFRPLMRFVPRGDEQIAAKNMAGSIAGELGIPEAWLAPLRDWFEQLNTKLADASLSEQDLNQFLADAAQRLPELFGEMDINALAELIEADLTAATLDGITHKLRQDSAFHPQPTSLA